MVPQHYDFDRDVGRRYAAIENVIKIAKDSLSKADNAPSLGARWGILVHAIGQICSSFGSVPACDSSEMQMTYIEYGIEIGDCVWSFFPPLVSRKQAIAKRDELRSLGEPVRGIVVRVFSWQSVIKEGEQK